MRELLIKVEDKINEMKKRYPVEDFVINYDLTSIRILGRVKFNYGKKVEMNLNKTLLKEFGDVYINEVVVHEFAHIVVRANYPTGYNGYKKVQGHGLEWKNVCYRLGMMSPKSTTTLFSNSESLKSKTNKRSFEYTCGCTTHNLTTRRHNMIINKGKVYLCNHCKNKIEFVKEV
jgi:SprT protein